MIEANLLLDGVEDWWEGCHHLDCKAACDIRAYHCARLAEALATIRDGFGIRDSRRRAINAYANGSSNDNGRADA